MHRTMIETPRWRLDGSVRAAMHKKVDPLPFRWLKLLRGRSVRWAQIKIDR